MSSIARFLFLRARPGRCRSSVDGAPVACTVWRYFRCGDRSLDATSIKKSESPAGRRHVRQPPSEALLLPSEKGATTSDNLAKIMLSHQPHTLLGQTNILNARCEVHGDREPCVVALHACRLLPMKFFLDVDRRFVHHQFMEERTCLTASLI